MGCRTTPLSSLLFLLFFLFLATACQGEDTLTQGGSLRVGQTLVSRGGVFELGFFTFEPGNSSRYYLGIWYYDLSPRAVVWVANRNDPVIGASGSLTIASDGNLTVLDGAGKRRWWSNSSGTAAAGAGSAVLQLMDNGNLFFNASNGGNVLWQSFDHPTDTFLIGMRLTMNKGTGRGMLLRSWRSATDPAEGDYSMGLDPAGSRQVIAWRGATPYWRSGLLSGGIFEGVRGVRPLDSKGWQIDPGAQDEMVLTFRPFNSSLFRFALQWNGTVNIFLLDSDTKKWSPVTREPHGDCDRYNRCGNNSMCVTSGDGEAACQCPKGFWPRSEKEWGAQNWTGGCVRKTPLKCEMNGTAADGVKGDVFWLLERVKLPDMSQWRLASQGECERGCLARCSCTAYAYREDGCFTWSTALVDVQQYPDGGGVLHIKLPASELAQKSKTWKVILMIALLLVIVVLLCFYLWWAHGARMKGWWNKCWKREVSLLDLGSRREVQPEFRNPTEFVHQTNDGKSSELPIFNFDSIAAATDNFSKSNKLGQGGFGHVYKGILPDGREVAVKRLSESSGQGLEEFKNEVILIAKLQHRNLVRLMGCCIQEDEKILIYEYMPNKSLDAFIFNASIRPLLDWRKRFNIIEGIARGLLYLHRDSRLRIIHRDLKASNILLDEEMNPKISDFGMARIFGGNQNQANTTRVVGTFGYMSPEYAMEGLFSIKSDVYSFGVLTLEIISGQRNSSFHRTENSPNLVGHAWKLWNEDKSLELVDPSIRSTISTREVMRCIQVGLLCVQDRANDRPAMSSVVFMLENEAVAHPVPRQPTFTLEGSPTDTASLPLEFESVTGNNMTVTVVTAR